MKSFLFFILYYIVSNVVYVVGMMLSSVFFTFFQNFPLIGTLLRLRHDSPRSISVVIGAALAYFAVIWMYEKKEDVIYAKKGLVITGIFGAVTCVLGIISTFIHPDGTYSFGTLCILIMYIALYRKAKANG